MTSPYADWKKDGLTVLLRVARTLCGIIQQWGGVIKSKYSENTAIVTLVELAEALCVALPSAQAEFDAYPSDDPLPPTDTSTILGIDPSAPAEPDPTEV